MTIALYARRKRWPLDEVVVRLRHSRVHGEDCADCETKAGMLDVIEREIALSGRLSEEQRAQLRDIADRCPVHRTLTSEIKIRTRLI
jgi:putative redox protein